MRKLPGDMTEKEEVERIIRVDHAGEYGAMRIYAGQLAVMKNSDKKHLIEHMTEQEKQHLETFEELMKERYVRPTLFMPLWHIAGFALGAATALMGEKAAFACTVAVESVIDEHYAEQGKTLVNAEPKLAQTIEQFRIEEMEHHNLSMEQGAEETPLYPVLSLAVKTVSKLAIWLSSRI
jgi:ubiquinone biosynthesis monooxygenase Coq7